MIQSSDEDDESEEEAESEEDEDSDEDDAESDDEDESDEVFEGPLYKSLSQPPPFRMNPGLSAIIRRAFIFPHFGHFFTGFSVMRCSFSNSCPQASH